MARRRNRGDFTRGYFSAQSSKAAVEAIREYGEHALEAAKAELKKQADIIVQEAKYNCPVRTGKLRDSIEAKGNKDGTVYRVSANAQDDKGFYYGQIVEFSPRINKPFLYPAFDKCRDPAREAIKDAMRRAIERGS